MTIAILIAAIMAATGIGMWRLLRRQHPHPITHRRTVDYDELRRLVGRDNR